MEINKIIEVIPLTQNLEGPDEGWTSSQIYTCGDGKIVGISSPRLFDFDRSTLRFNGHKIDELVFTPFTSTSHLEVENLFCTEEGYFMLRVDLPFIQSDLTIDKRTGVVISRSAGLALYIAKDPYQFRCLVGFYENNPVFILTRDVYDIDYDDATLVVIGDDTIIMTSDVVECYQEMDGANPFFAAREFNTALRFSVSLTTSDNKELILTTSETAFRTERTKPVVGDSIEIPSFEIVINPENSRVLSVEKVT
ncbi:hypothetical protein ACFL24_02155 [Patescibacteria group bacterium]